VKLKFHDHLKCIIGVWMAKKARLFHTILSTATHTKRIRPKIPSCSGDVDSWWIKDCHDTGVEAAAVDTAVVTTVVAGTDIVDFALVGTAVVLLL
jgi:hypothetical protein